jgi:hypothetical protein
MPGIVDGMYSNDHSSRGGMNSDENVELVELHSFAGVKHPDEQESDPEEVGQHWPHCAMARESRLLLEVVIRPRTEESATKLVEVAAKRLPPDCCPLWSSDGWASYLTALTLVFAVLIHFIHPKRPGRPKEPQVVPDPRMRYGQVIKQCVKRRQVSVTRRVIFGVEELIPLKQISTSLLERLNGTIRQHVVPLTLSKRRKKHHQNSRPSAEKPTSLTLIGFSIFTFMPKEKAALVIIKTRLLDPALGEWPSRRRTRRAVRPSSFLHLLKVTGTIYRNRGASLDMDPL